MRNNFFKPIYLLVAVMMIGSIIFTFSNSQYATRKMGGSYVENLPKNVKVVNVTWKDSNLWILTRPMKDNEQPETYTFKESSLLGVLEGTVTIKESK